MALNVVTSNVVASNTVTSNTVAVAGMQKGAKS